MEWDREKEQKYDRRMQTMEQSQSSYHEKQIDDARNEEMTGFKPGETERSAQARPHEILNLENAFGNIVLGVNQRQEYTFLVREKKRLNSPELKKDHKELEGDQKKIYSTRYGVFMTNSYDPKESAVAVRTQRGQPANRMVRSLTLFANQKDQQSIKETLPFTDLRAEQAQVKALEQKAAELRLEHTDFSEKEAELVQNKIEEMRHSMWKQERMRAQVDRALKRAVKTPSKWLDDKMMPQEFLEMVFGSSRGDNQGEDTEDTGETEETENK